ncbi:hypothetical protein FQN50_003651 [Emmonsiellopsis sp. PD_5]|nr:hypothetical protein FQN50_003651 [Emmonsiellopsis sp. PD_5]
MVSRKRQRKSINVDNLELFWTPVGRYRRAHGDSKSSMSGIYFTECMKGSDGMYHVRLKMGSTELFSDKWSEEPSQQEVLTKLRAFAESLP